MGGFLFSTWSTLTLLWLVNSCHIISHPQLAAAQSLVQDLQDGGGLECHMSGPR